MKNTHVYKFGGRVVKIAALASLLLFSLILAATAADYVSITPDEANELITSNKNLVILDIRAVEAYNVEHIKNAVCEEDLEDIDQYSGKEILVYDDNGTESEEFCAMLAQLSFQGLGLKKIYNLEGGLKAWQAAGFQTVKTRKPTPPLPSFSIPSPTSIPSPASTPVVTPTPETAEQGTATATATPKTAPASTTPMTTPASETPGFEALSVVIGLAICTVILKTRRRKL